MTAPLPANQRSVDVDPRAAQFSVKTLRKARRSPLITECLVALRRCWAQLILQRLGLPPEAPEDGSAHHPNSFEAGGKN